MHPSPIEPHLNDNQSYLLEIANNSWKPSNSHIKGTWRTSDLLKNCHLFCSVVINFETLASNPVWARNRAQRGLTMRKIEGLPLEAAALQLWGVGRARLHTIILHTNSRVQMERSNPSCIPSSGTKPPRRSKFLKRPFYSKLQVNSWISLNLRTIGAKIPDPFRNCQCLSYPQCRAFKGLRLKPSSEL